MFMNVLDCIGQGIFFLDGGTGTLLQERGLAPGELPELWNLSHPGEITAVGKAYYEAGSHAVCTNTFGASALKFDGKEGRPTVESVVTAAVNCLQTARGSAVGGQAHKFIALDVGPLGRLMAPLGDLAFEEAVELFAQVIRAGAKAGADLVLIETMNDCYETKAAVLAAKENCDLPVFVSKGPSSVEKVKQALREISRAIGEPEAGDCLLARMESDLADIVAKAGAIPPERRQTLVLISHMAAYGGKGSLFDNMCGYAGVINGAAVAGLGQNDRLTKEVIISVNPDLILIPTWNGGSLDVNQIKTNLENDPALQTVKAIRDKRLVQLPDQYLYCASQDITQAIRDMMNAAYPAVQH